MSIAENKKYDAQNKYHREHSRSISIRLMLNTEQDIIEKLDSVPNKAGYIKRLIRQDIKVQKKQ